MKSQADAHALESFNVVPNIGGQNIIINEGDEYEFVYLMRTRVGLYHEVGSRLRVLERTAIPAWGERSQSGFNWLCETVHNTTIWTTLEQCISRGMLRKVEIGNNGAQSSGLDQEKVPSGS